MMRNHSLLKWIVYGAAVLLVAVLQYTPHFMPRLFGIYPLFLIPFVVCIGMIEGETAGACYGIAAGLLWDAQGSGVFGFDALFLMLMGIGVGLLIQFLFRKTVVSSVILCAGLAFVHQFITWFFFDNLRGGQDFVYAFVHIMLPTSLYTAVFVIPLYFGVHYLNGRLSDEA